MAAARNRDDFTRATRQRLAALAGHVCSFPGCRRPTEGANFNGDAIINIGVASHICAASPRGPRYNQAMSPEERSSLSNGIWMCQVHAKVIDAPDSRFSEQVLREWKRTAERRSWRRVLQDEQGGAFPFGTDEATLQLRGAATAELEVLKRTPLWPSTSIPSNMTVHDLPHPVAPGGLARAAIELDNLTLVAAPGMGKTTTLLQLAEAMLTETVGTPLLVFFGEWGTGRTSLLQAILSKPSFVDVDEATLRAAAQSGKVALILDGWNELDLEAKVRARTEIVRLAAELPELRFVVSTRKTAMDVPVAGTAVNVLPLSEEQQRGIAEALRGADGLEILDRAWRTRGVSDLVAIPLYLTTLLDLPDDIGFPSTKEEVLRLFTASHDQVPEALPTFRKHFGDCQTDFLVDLASQATRTDTTALSDQEARRQISATATRLLESGDLTQRPQPSEALSALVDRHVLVRSGNQSFSFQHQQFQEWYASHEAERRILAAVEDSQARRSLQSELMNWRQWEEAILFAVERLARGDESSRLACGGAISAAIDVDPMLAAEMISRSTDNIWITIQDEVQRFGRAWLSETSDDRALRFIVATGRPEFGDVIWPLISDPDHQVSLPALRAAKRFHVAQLGEGATGKIKLLPQEARQAILHELVILGGSEGIELAAAIAKSDPAPEVVSSVVEALAFRQADRQLADVLRVASPEVIERVALRVFVEDVSDPQVRAKLEATAERLNEAQGERPFLTSLIWREEPLLEPDRLVAIIADGSFAGVDDGDQHLLPDLHRLYPGEVAAGLLARLRARRPLPFRAGDMLASSSIIVEDDALVQLALDAHSPTSVAIAAASVQGSNGAAKLLNAYLAFGEERRTADDRFDKAQSERHDRLGDLLRSTPGDSLVATIVERADSAGPALIEQFADLLARHARDDGDRTRSFSPAARAQVIDLVLRWGEQMLEADDPANRRHMASLASLAAVVPDEKQLPVLKRMLDANLAWYAGWRAKGHASGWTDQQARNEGSWPQTHEYCRAFLAIEGPEVPDLMRAYLADEHFGELAARVLAMHWTRANGLDRSADYPFRSTFEDVRERRRLAAIAPDATCDEADAIFEVAEKLSKASSPEYAGRLAISLAAAGASLPHGRWRDLLRSIIVSAPRRQRAGLLHGAALSGEVLDVRLVVEGIDETLQDAVKEPWILSQTDAYELRAWLRLLPFCSSAEPGLRAIAALPRHLLSPRAVDEVIQTCGVAKGTVAEDLLFGLAENDPRLFDDHTWTSAVAKLQSLSAAHRLVEVIRSGQLSSAKGRRYNAQLIAGMMLAFPEVRERVYRALRENTQGSMVLAHAVAEEPDAEGLLLLVQVEEITGKKLANLRVVERTVTSQVRSEAWSNAYDVIPRDSGDLRKRLLAMVASVSEPAAHCLTAIDIARDSYGAPSAEPRHPDLASGLTWPRVRAMDSAKVEAG